MNEKKLSAARAEDELEEARLRQQAIGMRLRHMFDEVVNEPIPQEFIDILRRADNEGGASESPASGRGDA